MDIVFLDPTAASWSAEIDRIGALLDVSNNRTIFPYHFLQVVLPKIGGHIVRIAPDDGSQAVGFLFPRAYERVAGSPEPRRIYTLRYHVAGAPQAIAMPCAVRERILVELSDLLQGAGIVFYDPFGHHDYAPTDWQFAEISIGQPNRTEAERVPWLHREIWGSPQEFLYPADIHSVDFQPGSSLVARVDGDLAAFLFGFYKFGGSPLPPDWHSHYNGDFRLESQTMGVLPTYRGMRIGNLLKRLQADLAWQSGIGVVNWTADPLQFPNAALNFGLLRALALDFYPDYYPFRNDLNRVPASRFGLTWLVGSHRVRSLPVTGTRSLILDLAHQPDVYRVNDGCDQLDFQADSTYVAFEIPADWTHEQETDLRRALRWREATDRLFAHYVGSADGKYVINGVGIDHERRYLIGERASDELWEALGRLADVEASNTSESLNIDNA